MSDESDEDLKTHEMQEITGWKEFEPLAFCDDLEKVMALIQIRKASPSRSTAILAP
jgi:hypothetical protein